MKVLLFSFVVLCTISSIVQAQHGGRLQTPRMPKRPLFSHRFRRQEPRGSISIQGTQPLDGSDRKPTIDLNYNHRLIDNGKTTLDAFGGANFHDRHVSPQAGFNYEHRFDNNMFVHGGGQIQPSPRGGFEPSFGAGLGWRFRRDATPHDEEEVAEAVY